jgi:acyl-CoA thioester hydrolase
MGRDLARIAKGDYIGRCATMTWNHPNPFTLPLVAMAGDIDGLDHTNNGTYVRWCEEIAWAHSGSLGLAVADYRRLDRAMAIRRAEYDYLLPTQLDDRLTLGTWIFAGDGRLALERRFQLLRDRDQATVLRGRWELVCIEVSSGRARRMPPEFLAAYVPVVQESNR